VKKEKDLVDVESKLEEIYNSKGGEFLSKETKAEFNLLE